MNITSWSNIRESQCVFEMYDHVDHTERQIYFNLILIYTTSVSCEHTREATLFFGFFSTVVWSNSGKKRPDMGIFGSANNSINLISAPTNGAFID